MFVSYFISKKRRMFRMVRKIEKQTFSLFCIFTFITLLGGALIHEARGAQYIDTCTTISESGTYILSKNITNSRASNCIYIKTNDVIFNGAGYIIDGTGALGSNGVYVHPGFFKTIKNVTVKNVIAKDWNKGIYYHGADNGKLEDNNVSSSFQGIYLDSSGSNILSGNIVNSDDNGISFISSSNSNTLFNNSVISKNGYGIYIQSSGSNNITGGSVVSENSYDYYLKSAGSSNYFRYTNFTSRKIGYHDSSSYFNYSNDPFGKIWIKTGISIESNLKRTLSNWNVSIVKFNDTNGTGNIIANYAISGLQANTSYKIYNSSQGKETNSYNLTSDKNGNLVSFTIALKGDTQIKCLVYSNESNGNITEDKVTISNVRAANITLTTAVITWQTNKLSDSLVKHGKSSLNYTITGYNSSRTLNHSVKLTNLSSGTTYYFGVNSSNTGNSNESQELSFTTLRPFHNKSVSVVYERVSDRMQNDIGRNISNMTDMLVSLKADIIFRGWWHETMIMDNCTQFLNPAQQDLCNINGGSYTYLLNSTTEIKNKLPESIFIGAVPAHQIYSTTYNPGTHQLIQYPDTWNMALDPAKLGISGISKENFQCEYAKNRSWLNSTFDCAQYDPSNVKAYFPDITNESFQEFLLALAKKQIDAGADGIWIDGIFIQAYNMAAITGDLNHSTVNVSYSASSKLIDEIHNYRQGVYIGAWYIGTKIPYPAPNIDFVTMSPSETEVLNQTFDESVWDISLSQARKNKNDTPIIAFIDWADTAETPLGAFSQNLSRENQSQFLMTANAFFEGRDVIFSPPVHGGYLGIDARKVSYGKYPYYDALAPESGTYDTILQLSREKASYK